RRTKIRNRQTRCLAIEIVSTGRSDVRLTVRICSRNDATENNLMVAALNADIVIDLHIVVIERGIRAGPTSHRETRGGVADRHGYVLGQVTVSLDAEVRSRENLGAHSSDVSEPACQTERVDRIWTD